MTRARTQLHAPTARLASVQAPAVARRKAGLRAPGTPGTSGPCGGRYTHWAQAALVWLLLALVVVPSLGRLHQVMHAPALQAHALSPAAAGAGAPITAAHTGESSHTAHAQGLLDLLLAHHAPVDCLLLDQLALGDALHSAPTALAAPAPAQAPLVHPAATAAARHVALFQARGPPAVG